jgi:hypothetical protein
MAVKVFFSEAAANTVISPDKAGFEDEDVEDEGDEDEDAEDEPEPTSDPQAAVARTRAAVEAAVARPARVPRGRIMTLLQGSRR